MIGAVTALLLAAGPAAEPWWGSDGHELVCRIAWERLDEAGRALAEDLLGEDAQTTFPASCYWADQVRATTHRHTASYHFVNIPSGVEGLDMTRDCSDIERRCVTWAVRHYATVLEDTAATRLERLEALKFLGHLVADLHQPLHAGRQDDRGGNAVDVQLFANSACAMAGLNLHRLWDVAILCHAGVAGPEGARMLNAAISEAAAAHWMDFDIVAWTNESYRIVEEVVYDRVSSRIVSRDYTDRAATYATQQLQRAAVRLAFLINRAAAGSVAFDGGVR